MRPKFPFAISMLITLCFLLMANPCFSKKSSTIYIGTNGKLTSLKNAIYMQKVDSKSRKKTKVQTWQHKDTEWLKIYSEIYKKKNDSTYQITGNGEGIPPKEFRVFYKLTDNKWKFKDVVDGQITRQGNALSVKPLLLDGEVTEYYFGGIKKSVSIYKNNELVSNENWNEDGSKYIDKIFYSADVYPTYSGGNKALNDHILQCYKESGLDISTVSGTLLIGFVVLEDGQIDGFRVLKGLGPKINTTACEAIKTLGGKWTPAKLNNHKIRYFQVFPINFIYKENHLDYAELRDAVLHYGTY